VIFLKLRQPDLFGEAAKRMPPTAIRIRLLGVDGQKQGLG
jgi:hypothetical protein